MLMRGYNKQKALIKVGWKPKDGSTPNLHIPDVMLIDKANTHDPPHEQWQERAREFYQQCEHILWSDDGKAALAYLHSRGLTNATIVAAHLGYHPCEETDYGYKWGRQQNVILAQGITIPWLGDLHIWRITIRDYTKPKGEQGRYTQVSGGSNGLYCADTLKRPLPVIMVEGEFDALSIAQSCGLLVNVVATGTTQGSHSTRWLAALARAATVLIAFDAEKDKGDKAVKWWMDRLENAQRLRPLWDDANQLLQDGVNLWDDWIQPCIQNISTSAQSDDSTPIDEVPPGEPIQDSAEEPPQYQPPVSLPVATKEEIDAAYERLSVSPRVMTPDGPGEIWGHPHEGMHLRADIERGRVRVILDCLVSSAHGATRLFAPDELTSLVQPTSQEEESPLAPDIISTPLLCQVAPVQRGTMMLPEYAMALYEQVKQHIANQPREKKYQHWDGDGTGFDSGRVAPTEYGRRVYVCAKSGDPSRIEAACTAMQKRLSGK